jgi:CheY-like chemotaxis protein
MPAAAPLVHLIHWKEEEIPEKAKLLRNAGYRVISDWDGKDAVANAASTIPAVIVIDLARLPSHGRATAFVLRQRKATRSVPLVFVGGNDEKISRVRETIPEAVFTQWKGIRSALKKAIATPAASLRQPRSSSAGYSGTPLPRKLGIKPGSSLTLLGAPQGFDDTLGVLAPGVNVKKTATGATDLLVVFVRSIAELTRAIRMLKARKDEAPVWIAWPKRTSPLAGDVSETEVRAEGLAAAMVDFKVCAIDADWSGLKFSRRRK